MPRGAPRALGSVEEVEEPRRRALRRARGAVALLFVVNAGAYANVVPRLPGIKADLGLSNTALGTAVAAVPVGALLSGLVAGALIARWGSARVATACGLGFAVVVPAISLASSWAALAGTFVVFGLLDSVMDVSMNAHALRVQRGYGRSIVSAMHGLWSLGAVAGAGLGSLAAGAGLGLRPHLVLAGGALGALTLAARRHLLPGPDDVERDLDAVVDTGGARDRPGRSLALTLTGLGLLLVLAGAVEDSPASWGAVLLRDELGASAGVAGLVFVAFQAAMTVGRLRADRLVDRFGSEAVLRAGSALIVLGATVGLLVGTPASVVAGFAVAGLGAAPLFPVVFHAAGNLPGVRTGHGVAAVAWASRLGFLVVPPLVGLVGDAVSVRAGLAVVPVAGLALLALAGTVRGTDAPRFEPGTVGP